MGACRPLEEESSFGIGRSTHPVSEIVTVCLNPMCLVSFLCCDEVSREVAFVLIAISIRYCGVRIPLLYM